MATLKRNLIFNYLGSFLIAIFQFISIPFYIKLLGKDAYGLVGFYGTLQAVFIIFDMGISATFNREMAKNASGAENAQYAKNLFKTFETVYWGIAIAVGALIVLFSSVIATHWINDTVLPSHVKIQSVIMMGILLLFRWPIGLYTGGLFGLQQQVVYNLINLIVECLKAGGSILLLYMFKPDIRLFFGWQMLMTAITMVVLRIVLKRKMPSTTLQPVFNAKLITSLRHFTLGMSGISMISIVVYEADKMVVAKLTTLALLGIYSTTSSVASSLSRFSSPIGQSVYPRMVQEVQKNNTDALANLFNKSSQLMAVLVIPVSFLIFFFSKELLFLWTKNETFATTGDILLKFFILGNLAVTLNAMPYMLQLSYGYTKLTLMQNIILLVTLVPALFIVVPIYGAAGAAFLWMTSNILVLIISSFVMFRKFLPTHRNFWYVHYILKPVVIGFCSLLGCRILFNYAHLQGLWNIVGFIAASGIVSFIVLASTYTSFRVLSTLWFKRLIHHNK
jgi:O-antigen/teichoic acid export membrane protein